MATLTPTKSHFPRFDPPIDSRSPSRSPRRRAQFAVKELDPLLGNLSPDSTLKALQATETIPGGPAQDALASSIGDATPAEREIGIRAAFAAQKLREWNGEISQWSWPGKRERSFGLGFITPQGAKGEGLDYCGFLTETLAEQYETRLEEIRDDLDSLGIDDIKDHVLEAHVPAKASPKSPKSLDARTNYGRMRDFTALITATVIQALPDLAKIGVLLGTWDARLRVLRELPRFLRVMESTQNEIRAAYEELRDPALAQRITDKSFGGKKVVLGEQVSDVGRRIDRLLDILEGHDDSLPQVWIDRLEKIELDYATWVVDAQHVVFRNSMTVGGGDSAETVTPDSSETVTIQKSQDPQETRPETGGQIGSPQPQSSPRIGLQERRQSAFGAGHEGVNPRRKPSLKLDLPEHKGHRREISKVSVADSTYSTFSDISNAEIMDAKTTSVLPSPKVSVVDNPFRTSRDELTWFGNPSAAQQQMATKPPMLQRASTASIEVVPHDQLRRVMLRGSVSFDMLSQIPQSPESTPSKALKRLTGSDSPTKHPPVVAELEGSPVQIQPSAPASEDASPLATRSFPSEAVRVGTADVEQSTTPLPALPRRSSKRDISNSSGNSSPLTLMSSVSTVAQDLGTGSQPEARSTAPAEGIPSKAPKTGESLDDKIQDLLTTLPTNIRLAKDANPPSSTRAYAGSSRRSSTPSPGLTLSPVKTEPTSRRGSADPEIRLYHLVRTGQARDVPPVKLFVRAVGEGHRVMVRVGGGWADLGEYLREYSLHHGSRAQADGHLEVANFPTGGHRESVVSVGGNTGTSLSQGKRKSRSPTANQVAFDANSTPELTSPRLRSSPTTRTRSPELGKRTSKDDRTWTPPPVPPIPASYTATQSPPIASATHSDVGGTITSVADTDAVSAGLAQQAFAENGVQQQPDGRKRISTVHAPGLTTTTVVTPPTTSYTPLGAAGPKGSSRRATTWGALPTAAARNDAWVEGMVGKARAVSSGGSGAAAVFQGPTSATSTTTTTTTTTVTSPTPKGRRVSSYFGSSPSTVNSTGSRSPGTVSPSPSNASGASAGDPQSRRVSMAGASSKSKSRMSLSDIGGIKRVFLRRKTENLR